MDRRELAKECARIDRNGGNVRDYLRGLGFVSPWGTWYNLQREELGRSETQITLGKGRDQMKKTAARTNEEKLEIMIRAIKDKKDPYEVFEGLGYTDPIGTYGNVKAWAKNHAPEEYAKLPEDLRAYRVALKREKEGMTEKEPLQLGAGRNYEVQVVDRVPETVETPENTIKARRIMEAVNTGKITAPLKYEGFETCCVKKDSIGEMYRDHKRGNIEWWTPDGNEVVLTVEEWQAVAKDLPTALRILGVNA